MARAVGIDLGTCSVVSVSGRWRRSSYRGSRTTVSDAFARNGEVARSASPPEPGGDRVDHRALSQRNMGNDCHKLTASAPRDQRPHSDGDMRPTLDEDITDAVIDAYFNDAASGHQDAGQIAGLNLPRIVSLTDRGHAGLRPR